MELAVIMFDCWVLHVASRIGLVSVNIDHRSQVAQGRNRELLRYLKSMWNKILILGQEFERCSMVETTFSVNNVPFVHVNGRRSNWVVALSTSNKRLWICTSFAFKIPFLSKGHLECPPKLQQKWLQSWMPPAKHCFSGQLAQTYPWIAWWGLRKEKHRNRKHLNVKFSFFVDPKKLRMQIQAYLLLRSEITFILWALAKE